MPLVITHGWPGSIVEFHKVIEPLVDPVAHGGNAADAFHVICPSLPGFGFSGKPTATGWGIDRIAGTWAKLMDRLGYARYGAQGGDWGSAVTTAIGALDATHCAGIHITLAMSTRPNVVGEPTPEEARALKGIKYYADWDSGYSKQQATRPQTLGYGLTNLPAGQAAWILEKFWAWTDCDGHPENVLGRDELLDNVMLYWVTATAASSARLYWESFGAERRTVHKVGVPTGVAVFPREIVTPVRRWMEVNFSNIQHWSEMAKGGHFAAFEQPGAVRRRRPHLLPEAALAPPFRTATRLARLRGHGRARPARSRRNLGRRNTRRRRILEVQRRLGMDQRIGRSRGDGRFGETGQDQLQLAGIGDDVADGEDAGLAGRGRRGVDGDLIVLQRELPVGDRSQRHRQAEERQQRVGLDPLGRAVERGGGHCRELARGAFQRHEADTARRDRACLTWPAS